MKHKKTIAATILAAAASVAAFWGEIKPIVDLFMQSEPAQGQVINNTVDKSINASSGGDTKVEANGDVNFGK